MTKTENATIEEYRMPTPGSTPDDLKKMLISGIMELTHDERKELLDMWKGRNVYEELRH